MRRGQQSARSSAQTHLTLIVKPNFRSPPPSYAGVLSGCVTKAEIVGVSACLALAGRTRRIRTSCYSLLASAARLGQHRALRLF
jgi:hypothetical protein